MTGAEHYAAAERLIKESGEVVGDNALVAWKVAKAQVHATLALAAATSDQSPAVKVGMDRGYGS